MRPDLQLTVDARALRRDRPPVLLLSRFTLIRTLGLAGIPVILATADPKDPAFSSRYVCGRLILPEKLDERGGATGAALSTLLAAGDELGRLLGRRVPLVYGSDDVLTLIYRFRAELSLRFAFLANDSELGGALLDKARFAALAAERGLPVPRPFRWDKGDDASIAGVDVPLVAKPRVKTSWGATDLCRTLLPDSGKAKVYANGKALLADPDARRFQHLLTLQEYIEGGEDQVYSYHGYADASGELLASYCGRKIRTFPAHQGESSYIEIVHDDDLESVGAGIVRSLGLRGVFKMDLKRQPSTGKFFLLEINARFNLWNYLGAANGVNLAEIAYDHVVKGSRPGPLVCRRDYRWVDVELDAKTCREMRRRGELGWASWAWSLLWTRRLYHVWTWRDPLPTLSYWWRRARDEWAARRREKPATRAALAAHP